MIYGVNVSKSSNLFDALSRVGDILLEEGYFGRNGGFIVSNGKRSGWNLCYWNRT